ncbi:MAG TPA: class I SAM-dependent methyltransferase [Gaiellaceae bacterium]
MAEAPRYNRWLFDRCAPYLGRRVLDAGAGIGTFSELAAPGREVVALEPDPELVSVLRSRFRGRRDVTVVAGTAEDVSGRFDSVVCLNVLEHISDDAGALAHFFDVLVPGGRLLLLVPAHPSLYGAIDRAVAHERRYDKRGLRELLERMGFVAETLRLVNPLGALGWLWSSRICKSEQVPEGPLRLYDRLVPLLRLLDRVELPVGLSIWAVARRRPAEHAQEERAEDTLDGERDERQAEQP